MKTLTLYVHCGAHYVNLVALTSRDSWHVQSVSDFFSLFYFTCHQLPLMFNFVMYFAIKGRLSNQQLSLLGTVVYYVENKAYL